MLKYRLITAIIAIPLIICAIWFLPPFPFAILTAIFLLYAAWEWSKLIKLELFKRVIWRVVFVIFIAVGLIIAVLLPMSLILLIGLLGWIWAAIAIWCYEKGHKPVGFQNPIAQIIIGILFLVPCWVGFYLLKDATRFGPGWLLFTIIMIWAADTGAYFIGRWKGKHLLIPKVSPKKTWEGFVGGVVLALLVGIIGSFIFHMNWFERWWLWLLALLTGLISVVGDLSISLLKRLSGVKDTGNLLPGHGGILDRIDSVMAAVTLFALGTLLLGF